MDGIISRLGNFLSRRSVFSTNSYIEALKNVSLHIDQGERVGIIGPNGAGKSTLLRMVAGLQEPTSGTIEVQGQVHCVMTLGAVLREDLSGRQNIYVDGEIHGKNRKDLSHIIDAIISFADLGDFIDYPVRTYSSGMKSRLAFAMIANIEPEILIIDEALSVGDLIFNQKASGKMREICEKGRIIILVSHSMEAIVEMCDRCIWLENGQVIMDGDPREVTKEYVKKVNKKQELAIHHNLKKRILPVRINDEVKIISLELQDKNNNRKLLFNIGEDLFVKFTLQCLRAIPQANFKLFFIRADGIIVTENSSKEDGFLPNLSPGEGTYQIQIGQTKFGKGIYEVLLEIISQEPNKVLATGRKIFKVENFIYPYENPIFFYDTSWHVSELSEENNVNN